MSAALRKVTRTKDRWLKQCADAQAEYVQAIRQAREAGHTMPEIGQAAGISKQAVLYHLNGRANDTP